MQDKKNILLFGSGLMAESVVIYLLRRPQNLIHIASNIVEDAKKIADNNDPKRCTYGDADVSNSQAVAALVKKADVVISYVPAFLHIHIAKVCLEEKKHLITASYVSPQMKELDEKVKENNLIFLNELGLDPGIDHLATMKIVDQVKKQNGKIIEYESWCGGLPSPQFCDNPIGYKFTWSPIGALRALNNKATYIEDDKEVVIQSKDLQYYGANIELNAALSLDGYPNRNSVTYKQIYGLNDAKKILRGTLRYKGFCTVINAWKQLGFLEEEVIKGDTWLELIKDVLKDQEGETVEDKIKSKCFDKIPHYANANVEEKKKKINHTFKAFKYFEMLNPETKIWDKTKSKIQNLVKLLEPKLALQDGETDLIAMQHIFLIEKEGKKILKKSSLIQIGEKKGNSAMSITVGTPTAIGAQLVLDGAISERGVLIPKYPDIYNPVLEKLAQVGVKLVDVDEVL